MEEKKQKTRTGRSKAAADEGKMVRISVRSLVEFILRAGDIDSRGGDIPDKDLMQMGSRLHRKIQKKGGADYQAEVPLSGTFACDDFLIRVEGRADGIITEQGKDPVIDEIKGVMRPLESIEAPVPVHLAQAKCYAYFYSRNLITQAGDHPENADRENAENRDAADSEKNPENRKEELRIGVRMTYANLETEEMKYFHSSYTAAQLEAWFNGVLEEYKKWARFEHRWQQIRTKSIHRTEFPFPYREGQKKLAGDVYRTIAHGKMLFIQAPTGSGKTLSTLFPSVKAMGEGLGERLFYLTARTTARSAAAQAFDLLREQGLRFKTVVLTAKEKICPLEKVSCNPEDCPYAKGHFDRINQAVYELITSQDSFTRENIETASRQYQVCPFELSLDLSSWMDGIIGDYNYVFHPRTKLKRFFGEGVRGDYIFLVDEAHNLVDRGRDMYSASLYKEDFLALKKTVKSCSPALSRSLEKVNRKMLEMKRECRQPGTFSKTPERSGRTAPGASDQTQGYTVLSDVDALSVQLMNLSGAMSDFLSETRPGGKRAGTVPEEMAEQVRELYFQVIAFLDTCDRLDEHYLNYAGIVADGKFLVRLLCVNPAANLQSCMDQARAAVLFSATFLPLDYYGRLLSTRTDKYAVYARSVFPPENLLVCIGTDTTSRYAQRGRDQYARIAAYIREAVKAKAGNYMVFFPSYRMLEEVAQVYREDPAPACRLLLQKQDMSEKEREAFLQAFSGAEEPAWTGTGAQETDRADTDTQETRQTGTGTQKENGKKTGSGSLVGLCVMGSIFSEGIDLREDRLIGAIIVGTGLPMVNTQQELLRQYYDAHDMDGFRYAYQCPGMNRVLQSAGRVIRTEKDRGIILLLDERFTYSQYRSMFPAQWRQLFPVRADTVADRLRQFWQE